VISRCDLSRPSKLVLRPIALGIDRGTTVSDTELTKADDELRSSTGAEFAQWLDWPAFSVRTSFAERSPYNRPRVVDLLTTLGVLDCSNRRSVRVQKAEVVEQTIREFDALEITSLCLIPITHLLNNDSEIEFTTERATRTTALLQQFLRDIGEPLEIPDKLAERHGIPKLKTSIPVIPAGQIFAGIVVPSMAATEEGAKFISTQIETALIHILFNETSFGYLSTKKDGKQLQLVVSPSGRGHYHVRQIDTLADVPSPFTCEQTLSAQTLAFNLGLVIEFAVQLHLNSPVQNVVEKRIKLIEQLCTWPTSPTLVGAISSEFLSE
jgi:hypothetical protein